MARPTAKEYAPYYHTYVGKVPEGSIQDLLTYSFDFFTDLCAKIPDSQADYRYEEGKWTIKEVIQHMIDTERVMQYRALRIGRNDSTSLAGFDQDVFADVADVSHRTIADLLDEFVLVRASSNALFHSFTEENMLHMGTASDQPVSTRALAYIIVGHQIHHQNILVERYLND